MSTITDWLSSDTPEDKETGPIGAWLNADLTRLKVASQQDTKPETAARILNVGIKTGLPREFITRNLDKVEQAVERRDFSPERFKRESPVFASWAAENPNHWAVVKDDYENLSAIEWIGKAFSASHEQGWLDVQLNRLYAKRYNNTASPEDMARIKELEKQSVQHEFGADDWFDRVVTDTARQLPQLEAAVKAGLSRGIPAGIGTGGMAAVAGQLGPQVALPEEVVTVPAATALGFSVGFTTGLAEHSSEQETGAAFREFLQIKDESGNAIDPGAARVAAGIVGVVNAGLEVTGMGLILKNVPGVKQLRDRIAKGAVKKALAVPTFRQALVQLGKGTAQSIGGEVATEVLQESTNILADELLKAVSPGDFKSLTAEQVKDRLWEIANMTLRSTLLIGGTGPVATFVMDSNKARVAKNSEALWKALGEKATESKLRERVPAKFREFVDKLRKEGGVSDVNIPVERFDEYFQSKDLDPEQVAQEIMGSPDAYREAKAANTDLAISLTDYAEKIAPTEHHNGLLKDLRLRADDMTLREAQTWEQEREAILSDLMENLPESSVGAVPGIYNDVLGQLLAAGHDQFAAERQAELFESVFATLASRTGMDPNRLYQRYGLRISRPLPEVLTGVTDFDTQVDPLVDRLRAGDIPTDKQVFGESLSDFLKARGGLQDDSELGARDAGKAIRGLIKKTGDTLDGAAEAAAEAGFIAEATPDALLEALDRELAGEHVSSGRHTDEPLQELRSALESLSEYLDSLQVDLSNMDNAQVRALLLDPPTFDQPRVATTSIEGFQTGVPVTFDFAHNTDSATAIFGVPDEDSGFGRQYEPSGRYVVEIDDAASREPLPGMMYGTLTFTNPLVIENDSLNWKRRLSEAYGGKKGKALSLALIADGYDGVVTVDNGHTSEILDLTTFDEAKALYQSAVGEPRLSAVHNLTEENLKFADDMGGLAAPSIAIVPDGQTMRNYGGVTLIGDRNLGDPALQPVFDADAYTQTFPRPEYPKVKTATAQVVVNEYRPFAIKFDDHGPLSEVWDNAVNTPNPAETINRLMRPQPSAVAWFLSEVDGETFEPVMVPYEPSRFGFVTMPAFRKYVESGGTLDPDYGSAEHKAFTKAVLAANRQWEKENYADLDAKMRKHLAGTFEKNHLSDEGLFAFGPIWQVKESYRKLGTEIIKVGETSDRAKELLKGREAEFQTWITDKIMAMYGDPFLRIARKKHPYTLDNIVEFMTRAGKKAGTEDTMTFGEGKARAVAATRFTELEWMRNASHQIRPEEEINEAREKAKELLDVYRQEVLNYYTGTDWRGEVDTWNGLDASMRALTKWAKNRLKRGSKAAMQQALRSEGFKGVPIKLIDKAIEAGKAFLEAPVPYFESKPQRAVSLNEFAGAAIPEDASDETKAILDKHGIPYRMYPAENDREAARAGVVDKFRRELSDAGMMTLFQSSPSRMGFTSGLLTAAQSLKQAKGTGQQMLAMIKKQPGVKDEELQWTGLPEFLAAKEKVTKDEIIAFVQANGVQIKEVTLAGEEPDPYARVDIDWSGGEIVDEDANAARYDVTAEGESFTVLEDTDAGTVSVQVDDTGEFLEILTPLNQQSLQDAEYAIQKFFEDKYTVTVEGAEGPAKYPEHALPGGENYREILLILPASGDQVRVREDQIDELDRQLKSKRMEPLTGDQRAVLYGGEGAFDLIDDLEARLGLYVADIRAALSGADSGSMFVSHAFDQPNILAWVRLTDRTGPNGERVLFVEELQSDWHQKGRRSGYGKDSKAKVVPRNNHEGEQGFGIEWQDGEMTGFFETQEEAQQTIDELPNHLAVPDAPFKGNAWVELALKRVLRMAAEGGYDQVAWTTGGQQNERYDLSKQINRLWYEKQPDGTYKLSADAGTGEVFRRKADYTADELDEVVGKEMADRIRSGVGKDVDGGKEMTGLDLKVGGKGMIGFYDRTMPNLMKKVARKLDKNAAVSKTELGAPQFFDLDTVEDEERMRAMRGIGEVHAMPVTDAMRERAMAGQTLFQEKRGSITFNEQTRQATIRLFKSANLSTVLHESGHLYLEILGDLAEAGDAPEQIVQDYTAILKWFGIENRQAITREHHEQFARGFEAYLREGKAPSVELQNAFASFRAWLVNIYRKLTQLNVELTDEVRRVFDRMLATDEAIATAHESQNYVDLFSTPESAGKSPEEFAVYRAQVEAARLESEQSLTAKLLAIETRESQKWWKAERAKMREDVGEEVHKMRVYRALALIRKGQNPDGTKSRLSQVKLDRDQLVRLYGKDFLKRLPRPYVYAAEGGVDVDTVAGLFGYGSGDEMIRDMVNARPMNQLIEAETDARMKETYPDPMTDGTLAAQAMTAVHNEKRGELLAAEMKALRRLSRRDRPIVSAALRAQSRQEREARQAGRSTLPNADERRVIRAAAVRIIGARRVRDLRPGTYRTAEAKASRAAFLAAEKKDYETAYQEKRRQLLNHELFRAAEKAKAQSESIRTYLQRFSKKNVRQRLGKAGEGLLEQIDLVLSDIDLRRMSGAAVDRNKARVELMKMIDEGAIIASPEVVKRLQADSRENWIELSVEQFRGIRDIVKQLETRASRLSAMVINGEKLEIATVAGEIGAAVVKTNKRVYPGIGQETAVEGIKHSAKQARESWLRPASIARILDGTDFGPITKYIIVPMRRAYTERLIPMERKARDDMADLYNKFYSKAELGKFSTKFVVDALEANLSKSDILSIALNWGAEGNRQALLSGRRLDGMPAYTQAGVIEVLQEHLDARDWEFVQAVWDYLDSYWPELSATEKRRRGIAPKKVPASPFTIQTKDGQTVTVRGGYYPLKYDSRHGYRTKELEIEDHYKKMGNGIFVSATTRAGATHERVGSGGQLVRLGLGNIDRHLREIIRDMAIGDEVNFIKRVMENEAFRNAMAATGNTEAREALNLWLQDSAVGEMPAYGAIEQGLAYVRTGFTKAKLAWNVLTTVLQTTGIFQTWAVVGSEAMAHGVGRFNRNPLEAHKHIMATSKFMQVRYESNTWNKDVADTQAHLGAIFGGGLPTRAAVVTKGIAATYFWPIAKMQMQVDEITWLAAYWKGAEKKGLSDADAVLFADATVEQAQTSGIFSDRSGIERGTSGMRNTRQSQFIRIWTTLISYMLAKGNIAYEKGHAFAKKPTLKGAVYLATDLLLLYTVEALMSAAIYGRLPDDDDDEPWLPWLAKETGLSAVSGIPFVREIYGARFNSGNTPVGSLSKDLYDLYSQIAQGEIDRPLLKELNNVGGTLLHYPSSQTNRLIDTFWRENVEDEDVAIYEYLTGERDRDE